MSEGTLKRYVNDAVFWNAFLEELDAAITLQHKRLEQSSEPVTVYRCQGEIFALKRMKLMKDKFNGY